MQKSTATAVAIVLFVAILFIITTIHDYEQSIDGFQTKKQRVKMQQGRIADLLSFEIPNEWKKDLLKQEEEKKVQQDSTKQNKTNETNVQIDQELSGKMTREELGRHGWNLLHMIASTYPEEVDEDFVVKTNVFLNLFGQFYPCKECSQHFLQGLKKNQFNGKGRDDFAVYLCQMHNRVNKGLGKEDFNCSLSNIGEKWGGCGCSEN